jgi:hypothetical protein
MRKIAAWSMQGRNSFASPQPAFVLEAPQAAGTDQLRGPPAPDFGDIYRIPAHAMSALGSVAVAPQHQLREVAALEAMRELHYGCRDCLCQ